MRSCDRLWRAHTDRWCPGESLKDVRLCPPPGLATSIIHRRLGAWAHGPNLGDFVEDAAELSALGQAKPAPSLPDTTEGADWASAADQAVPALGFVNTELRLLHANQALRRWFVRQGGDPVGRHLQDLLTPQTWAAQLPAMQRALAGERVSSEDQVTDSHSRHLHVRGQLAPVRNGAGSIVGLVVSFEDITERVQQAQALQFSEQRWRRMAGSLPLVVWTAGADGLVDFYSAEADRTVSGGADISATGFGWIELLHPDDRTETANLWMSCVSSGKPFFQRYRFMQANGSYRWCESRALPSRDDSGRVVQWFGVTMDIERLMKAEKSMRVSEQRFRSMFDQMHLGCALLDVISDAHAQVVDFRVVQLNPMMVRLFDRPGEQPVQYEGRTLRDVLPNLTQQNGEFMQAMGRAALTGRSARRELFLPELERWLELVVYQTVPGQAAMLATDTTERHRLSMELAHRASHDSLTGLANRHEFETRLQRLVGHGAGVQAHAVLFIDLDQFKVVNDACGHGAGDRLLRQLSGLMAARTRTTDTLARLGGDEFGVILPSCPPERALAIAQTLVNVVDEFRFVDGDNRFRVGASIGLVSITPDMVDISTVLQAADSACYAAKEAGRNRVVVWQSTDGDIRARQSDTQWAGLINQALDDNGFVLFAQRIVPLGDRSAGLHAEVLLRMKAPDGAPLAPGSFMPAAERFHFMGRIDRWVVRQVFDLLEAQGSALGHLGTLSVNLSGQSLGDRVFHTDVLAWLDASTLDRRKLCFEVTETAAITNLQDAQRFIQAMHERGVRFSLDDFGSGASSFGYLKNLSVDYLKIDGQFVRNLCDDPVDQATVRCMVEVARAVDKRTIAEFVETAASADHLQRLGVDYAQGYHFHRPEPIEQALRLRP